jgi:hypothetical protein
MVAIYNAPKHRGGFSSQLVGRGCSKPREAAGPSHDSVSYGNRFMLRLDETTQDTLDDMPKHVRKSIAEIIRHLVCQATLHAFPMSWHEEVDDHCTQQARPIDVDI